MQFFPNGITFFRGTIVQDNHPLVTIKPVTIGINYIVKVI